jgi:murein DD-endopeptidase MepM/ murein hydrolase activator NlpD
MVTIKLFRGFFCCVLLGVSAALFLGCAMMRPSRSIPRVVYTVKDGDTLTEISSRYRIAQKELLRINRIDSGSILHPGQKLRFPERYLERLMYQPNSVSSREILEESRQYVGNLQWPLMRRGKINSRFGKRWSSFHEGVDLAGKPGDSVFAAHDGEVVYSGQGMSGYGNMVVIRGENFMTAYAHNRRNTVSVGDSVRQGQKIAEVGMTGRASGPHLHFETRVQNSEGKYVAVDPFLFFQSKDSPLTLVSQ